MLPSMSIMGVGIVSPFGINNREAVVKFFEETEFSSISAIEKVISKIKIRDYLSSHQKDIPVVRYMDTVSKAAIIAASGSMKEAGISDEEIINNPYRYGLLLATKNGPSSTRKKLYDSLDTRKGESVSATLFSNCGYNIAGSLVSGFFGIKGVNLTFSGSQNLAISLLARASNLLSGERVDTLLVGYSDSKGAGQGSSQISFSESSCILCIKRTREELKHGREFILEYVDESSLNSDYDINEPLIPGYIYSETQSKTSACKARPCLIRLDMILNSKVNVDPDYLPFIQIGLLWNCDETGGKNKHWIIPVQVKNGITCIKVST